MWMTVLNREKREINFFKRAIEKVCGEKGDRIILGYGYISTESKLNNVFDGDILKKLAESNMKGIIIVGENDEKNGINNHIDIAKYINNLNTKIPIIVYRDKDMRYHKKIMIKYHEYDLKPTIGIIGSSNFTSIGCFQAYESTTICKFQKNTDILIGKYKSLCDVKSGNIEKSYKMILDEIEEQLSDEDKEVLGEWSVSIEMERCLEDMIKEMEYEERWSEKYEIAYVNSAYINKLLDEDILRLINEKKVSNNCNLMGLLNEKRIFNIIWKIEILEEVKKLIKCYAKLYEEKNKISATNIENIVDGNNIEIILNEFAKVYAKNCRECQGIIGKFDSEEICKECKAKLYN